MMDVKDWMYFYGELQDADKKLPADIYAKLMDDNDFTEDEIRIIKTVIDKDKGSQGLSYDTSTK